MSNSRDMRYLPARTSLYSCSHATCPFDKPILSFTTGMRPSGPRNGRKKCVSVCLSRERGLGLQELVETLRCECLAKHAKLRTAVEQRLDALGVHSIAPHPHVPSPGQFNGF